MPSHRPFPHLPSLPLLTLAVLFALLPLGCRQAVPPAPIEEADGPPRLVVLVVFDQLRGDYLQRWQDLFEEGGFRRLQTQGAWFPDCHVAYSGSSTAPGHASILAGCPPAKHGIIENDWFDRSLGEKVYCVGSDRYRFVPPTPGAKPDPKKLAGTPERLLVPTFADALTDATGGQARVVSLSLKDRSAVLPGGHHRTAACYWLDGSTGTFVTSTYYRDRLHPWAEEFNAGRPADRWFGRDWDRLRADVDYVTHSGPDDVAGEGKGVAQGRAFPHPTTGGLAKPGKNYYSALANSPYGNELLLELAKKAIDGEQLGTREVPDLLAVSFSSNDLIGHCWGPDSQEVLDVTLRSDRIVKELVEHLDARVGRGRYLLVLTADHGICPLPEVARQQYKDARRVNPDFMVTQLQAFLEQKFGKGGPEEQWVECVNDQSAWLNQGAILKHGLTSEVVEKAAADWMCRQPGVLTAYPRTALLKGVPTDDVIGQRVRRSFHPERSGDVMVVLKPHHLLTGGLEGTNHGSPHAYDTHVPFLVYSPCVCKGVHSEAIAPQAAAAIFAHALGIKPPSGAETPVPEGLFRTK